MLADWLPNLHPLVVHFPIALLVVAVLLELGRLAFRRREWLDRSVLLLYGLGTLGLVAAFLSGRRAAETVEVEGAAFAVLTSHEDWGLATMVFFLVFSGLRLGAAWRRVDQKRWAAGVLAIMGGVGVGMLAVTADRGGELVFRHGAGVAVVQEMRAQLETLDRELQVLRGVPGPEVAEDGGSWNWSIAPGSAASFRTEFLWLQGDPEQADMEVAPAPERGSVLEIVLDSSELMVVLEEELRGVEGRLRFEAEDFVGSLALVHNVRDQGNYQYLRTDGERVEQGQMVDGNDVVLGTGTTSFSGWTDLRVQASDGHLYGHLGGEQRVHAHGTQMAPGFAGVRIRGSGILRIQRLAFQGVD